MEKEEYPKDRKVGFFVSEERTRFVRSRRHFINYDWDLKYEEISGVAFGNVMRGDDDSYFIIFIRADQAPVYFNMTYDTEEMQEFASFMEQLKEKLELAPVWEQDKIVIAYPKNLAGKELYCHWSTSIATFVHEVARQFGFRHHVSGIIKAEFRDELKIKA